MNLSTTYKNKKVFLTGHTGFKGTWLLLMLKKLGADVKAYALPPKNSHDLYRQINGDALCNSVMADIRDKEKLRKELLDYQPDFVFHLAAQALVIDSYTFPVETYETNVMGTVYLLDAIRQLQTPCTNVIITTDKVYENFETDRPYAENDKLGGYDPYSNSKACAELAVASYRNSFFNPSDYGTHKQGVCTARSGNVIGGGDWSDNRLVPDIARALKNNTPVVVRNPAAVRPWQHVLDPLYAYLLLGSKCAEEPVKFSTGFNFGPETADVRTVEDMVKLSIEAFGSGAYECPEMGSKPHEAGLLKLEISKAKEMLGWKPHFESAEAVQWTMDWYKHADSDPKSYTEKQIAQFLEERQ